MLKFDAEKQQTEKDDEIAIKKKQFAVDEQKREKNAV